MTTVSTSVEVDVSPSEFSTQDLLDELEERGALPAAWFLLELYEYFRSNGNSPQFVRDYIYAQTGKVLP